jgi:tRNA (pseudouridine54-N1)-methyltransferase
VRQFIVVGHDAPTTPEFPLDDLPGSGRLDLLARCVTSSLLVSHGIRTDVRTHLVFDDTFTVSLDGSAVRRLNPDERSTAALLRTALDQREEAVGRMAVETSPGVSLTRVGVAGTLDAVTDSGTLCLLHEDGTPAADLDPPTDPVFLLSDHRDFTDGELSLAGEYVDERMTLGPERLHADQAISVAHNWLDTDGFTAYRG